MGRKGYRSGAFPGSPAQPLHPGRGLPILERMGDKVTAVTGRRALRSFVDLPRKLYAGDPNFIPPLTSEEVKKLLPGVNPFFDHARAAFWTLERDGIPVGRISATRDRSFDDFHGEKAGFFGHFEAPDLEGARLLLETARTWLAREGAEFLRGPVSLSTNYTCGLLVEGFDGPPVVDMPYNPPSYAEWMEALGLAKAKDLLSLLISEEEVGGNPLEKLAERVRRRSEVRIRRLNKKDFKNEISRVRRIYNEAWKENWGFTPLEEEEFQFLAHSFKPLADPDLCPIAEIGEEPAGFALLIPDVNPALQACGGRLFPFGFLSFLLALRKVRRGRVILLGVRQAYRHRGIETLLIDHVFRKGLAKGYKEADLSWILEDNRAMLRPLEKIGARVWRRFRIYQAPLK